MGGDDNGCALVVDVAEQAQKFAGEVRVQVASGFVREDQAGLVCERACDGDSLLFASRKDLRKG